MNFIAIPQAPGSRLVPRPDHQHTPGRQMVHSRRRMGHLTQPLGRRVGPRAADEAAACQGSPIQLRQGRARLVSPTRQEVVYIDTVDSGIPLDGGFHVCKNGVLS